MNDGIVDRANTALICDEFYNTVVCAKKSD